jgi:predicted nucleotidyltransferase
MFKHETNTDYEVRKWGNSGGALLPKEWLGKQIKVILIDRTDEIKKEVFEILTPYLEDIIGIYLTGSRAREEHDEKSDIDIMVFSGNSKKYISSGKYNIEIYPISAVLRVIEENPIAIYPRLIEAKPLLNKSLLEKLKSVKLTKKSFIKYADNSKIALNTSRHIFQMDIELKSKKNSPAFIYSIILRLRGFYLAEALLSNKRYSNEGFKKWLTNSSNITKKLADEIYESYREIRDGKRVIETFSLEIGGKLLSLLEKEVQKYGKKKKKA